MRALYRLDALHSASVMLQAVLWRRKPTGPAIPAPAARDDEGSRIKQRPQRRRGDRDGRQPLLDPFVPIRRWSRTSRTACRWVPPAEPRVRASASPPAGKSRVRAL